MLGKSCQEKGELEGVVGTEPSIKPPTPPNLPLALSSGDYNSHAGKGEGLVLHLWIILFTLQHHYALQVDYEYSSRLLQNDVGKALSLPQQRKPSPLITTFKCLANHADKRGELEGVASF